MIACGKFNHRLKYTHITGLYACVCNGRNYLLHRSVICGPLIRDKLHLGTFPARADILKDLLTHPANLH